ncbi:hypothetical protein [Acinetobacter sp.]|jgi:hypothetical protein|uniref:hypothetical protein n=1 Tax=Acinetobacter sp. TaxID=472 RepID=UPI0028248F71|nr:hypothetical protein [Acinetobacter sp.]MDR0236944.1 hypothetical protein [Acinetobacter sp.]
MKLKVNLPLFAALVSLTTMTSSYADAQFNQNLEQFLECKKTLSDYYGLGFEFEDNLKKNGWIKQGEDYSYVSKEPIKVFGQTSHEISLVAGGMLAVFKNANTKELAEKLKISQNRFFKDMPFFSGEKIVKTDPASKDSEKSVRKLTLAESNPVINEGENKTYLGCVYISELEQQQQEAALEAAQ